MIVPMKKATIVARAQDAKITVETLRSLGVLHVEHEQPPQGKEISELREDIALIDASVTVLSEKEFLETGVISKPQGLKDWKSTAKHIVDLHKRLEQLKDYSYNLISQIERWREWGDFEPKDIEELAKKDIHLSIYQIPVKEINNLPVGAKTKILKIKGGIANCAVIWQGRIEVPYKEIVLPKVSLSNMQARLSEDKKAMQSIKDCLSRFAVYYNDFLEIKYSLTKELEFQTALKGMGEAEGLVYLTGYLPSGMVSGLAETAKKEKWGVLIKEPAENDLVPVLLDNPRWVSLINPVYKLMEVVPNYRELDVSPIFLLFLALFFGMIIGDAGYGAVYFGLTFLAQRKFAAKTKDKTVFFLFYLFSSCAILWGLLTGTVFGQEWYLAYGFKALMPVLNDTKFLMGFCFLLGATQLSLGHLWQGLVKLPSLTALADIGFICLLWAGFFLAKMFILGDVFPVVGQWLVGIGSALILLFISPQKNFLKTIGAGLGALALSAMGNFGDVVSYIRLFAVGLAGVAVANSVNMLAAGKNIIAQIFILFIGHGINIILGPMSVLVHGIRLNVLEFSLLHGNVTWSGLPYKPLKR